MKERPILMSAPMVRALLAGTKTQTRRVVKPNGKYRLDMVCPADGSPPRCPYGAPGDRLWVREAWRAHKVADELKPSQLVGGGCSPIWYEAQDEVPFHPTQFGKLRPGMFMPRWASRILLEVTEVRVERLQDISEADAIAEGAAQHPDGPWHAYRSLWTLINGPGSWDANPWCWAVSFRRLT